MADIERKTGERYPRLYEVFFTHKGSCLRINMEPVLHHLSEKRNAQEGKSSYQAPNIRLSKRSLNSPVRENRIGWGNGLQLVIWTGSPNLIAKTNTLMGRFTLPSPYGVLHGYELSGAQFTLNVHSQHEKYPDLQKSITISPGFVTRVGLKLNQFEQKIKEKRGSCDEYTLDWKPGNGSEQVCLRDCMAKILYDTCGCTAPYGEPQFENFKFGEDGTEISSVPQCRKSDLVSDNDLVVFKANDINNKSTAIWRVLENSKMLNHSCRHRFRKNLAQKLSFQKCQCPNQCNYTVYDMKTELSTLHKLPRHISNRALMHRMASYYESMVGSIGPLEDHLSVIDLSFTSLDTTIYREEVSDSVTQLVSDLGGQLEKVSNYK